MLFGRTIRMIAPITLAAFIATGCGGADGVLGFGGIPDDAVCTVAGTPIRTAEFDRMFSNAEQQYEDNGREFPEKDSDEYAGLRSDLVEYLVQQALITNEARKFDLKASKKEIDEGVDELKQRVAQGDEKKFKEEMERVNYTLDLVRKDVEFDVISKKLYAKVVSDIKVSDEDAKRYYDENTDQFKQQESRDIAHILVKGKKLADEIYAEASGGDEATFTRLAKKHTEDTASKENGGLMEGVQRGQTVPEFDKAAFDLKTGEVSKPVKTTYGWHIISARSDVKPASTRKYDEVKEDIKTQLKGEQEGERYQEWTTDIREDAEKNVHCKDGYVWKQTVTETETAPEPEVIEEDADAEDADADDAKDAKNSKDDKDAKNSKDDDKDAKNSKDDDKDAKNSKDDKDAKADEDAKDDE